MKCLNNARGFTLVEIMTVVIIMGVMAAIAIPKVVAPGEQVTSGEGRQILVTLLGAQKRYLLENNAYTAAIANLDVTFPASQYFNPPAALNPGVAGNVASIARNNGQYTLSVDDTGVITCAGGGCAAAKCTKGAGGNRCN